MQISKPSSAHQNPEFESEDDDVVRFDKSLQELRELRSQLHYAADYCETSFLKAKQKKIVMENTKEYICRAMVTVVDHLGSVSANLSCCISNTNAFSDAELRINCLKQRLVSCEQYAQKLALAKLRWREVLPTHHRRYLSTVMANIDTSNQDLRDSDSPASAKTINKHELHTKDLPLFLHTYTRKSSPAKNILPSKAAVSRENSTSALGCAPLPVRDGLSIMSKGSNPTFHFQVGKQKLRRNNSFPRRLVQRRLVQGTDIFSLIRRAKRTTL